jgi:hypothetical protein
MNHIVEMSFLAMSKPFNNSVQGDSIKITKLLTFLTNVQKEINSSLSTEIKMRMASFYKKIAEDVCRCEGSIDREIVLSALERIKSTTKLIAIGFYNKKLEKWIESSNLELFY